MNKKLSSKCFGKQLQLIIKRLGLTQIEVAESCGIPQACLNKIILGKQEPRLITIVKILNFIPISFETLCKEEEK